MALDRDSLIESLGRLGDTDDAIVLQAAREVHRKATESGLSWDELIRAAPVDPDWSPADDSAKDEAKPLAEPDASDVARLIDRLLRKDLSDTLREDLNEMKRALGSGTLDPQDARYVRALARRLGV